jgi:hypothetical protein
MTKKIFWLGMERRESTAKVIQSQAEALERQQAQIDSLQRQVELLTAVGSGFNIGSSRGDTPRVEEPPSYDHVDEDLGLPNNQPSLPAIGLRSDLYVPPHVPNDALLVSGNPP